MAGIAATEVGMWGLQDYIPNKYRAVQTIKQMIPSCLEANQCVTVALLDDKGKTIKVEGNDQYISSGVVETAVFKTQADDKEYKIEYYFMSDSSSCSDVEKKHNIPTPATMVQLNKPDGTEVAQYPLVDSNGNLCGKPADLEKFVHPV